MFQKTRNQIKKIDFEKAMMEALSRFTKDIADMNRTQFWKGVDSSATKMVPPYAFSTRRIKKKKGQPVNRVTLKDVGVFYTSIEAVAEQSALIMGSTRTVKGFDLAGHLERRYSTKASIYGLIPNNQLILMKKIKPSFAGNIKNELA